VTFSEKKGSGYFFLARVCNAIGNTRSQPNSGSNPPSSQEEDPANQQKSSLTPFFGQTTAAEIDRIMDHYNHERLHSSLSFLRPIDFYRGNPTAMLADRRRKLEQARNLRKQENLKLRQRLLPWKKAKTVA